MNRRRVDYVILYVNDIQHSIAFYRDVVGLSFKFTEAGYAEFATEGTKFALYERARLHADRPWGHRTLHVLDPDGHVVEFAQEIPRRAVPDSKG